MSTNMRALGHRKIKINDETKKKNNERLCGRSIHKKHKEHRLKKVKAMSEISKTATNGINIRLRAANRVLSSDSLIYVGTYQLQTKKIPIIDLTGELKHKRKVVKNRKRRSTSLINIHEKIVHKEVEACNSVPVLVNTEDNSSFRSNNSKSTNSFHDKRLVEIDRKSDGTESILKSSPDLEKIENVS